MLLLLCAYSRVAVHIRVEQPHHVRTAAIRRIEPRHHVKTKHAHIHILRFDHHVAERLHVRILSHGGLLCRQRVRVVLLRVGSLVNIWCRVARMVLLHYARGGHVRRVWIIEPKQQ